MSELSDRVRKAVSVQGILAVALDDAISRGEQHFTLPPTDRELADWAASLKVSAPHFFPQAPSAPGTEGVPLGVPVEVWRGMSPSSKLSWARAHGYGAQPVERRPKPLTLTSEQAAALAAMPVHARVTAFRKMQQEQG